MVDIRYLEPTRLEEALEILAHYGEEAHPLAGGTFLALLLRNSLIAPRALVSLHRIPGLKTVAEQPGEGLRLGAMVTHREVEKNPLIRLRYPLLSQTYAQVANVRIRNQATVGGGLVDADYASDPTASLSALGARVHTWSLQGERLIPVQEFVTGHYETVLQPGELVTEVLIPPLPNQARSLYLKFRSRSSEDRPCASVAAVVALDGEGRCRDLRVVVGAVADRPQRQDELAEAVQGQRLTPGLIREIAGEYAGKIRPISDLRGSAWYREQLIEVLVRRALTALVAPTARVSHGPQGEGTCG